MSGSDPLYALIGRLVVRLGRWYALRRLSSLGGLLGVGLLAGLISFGLVLLLASGRGRSGPTDY